MLHGYIEFAGTPFNKEGDTDYALLKAIENGSGLYFLLSFQNTQELVDSARYVTGLAEEVDRATAGLDCHHAEKMGRSKGVMVLLGEDEQLPSGYDVTVQPMSLQKIFVALCGEEAK